MCIVEIAVIVTVGLMRVSQHSLTQRNVTQLNKKRCCVLFYATADASTPQANRHGLLFFLSHRPRRTRSINLPSTNGCRWCMLLILGLVTYYVECASTIQKLFTKSVKWGVTGKSYRGCWCNYLMFMTKNCFLLCVSGLTINCLHHLNMTLDMILGVLV